MGDREKTWTGENSSDSWPQTPPPPKIPNARVLTFGYESDVAGMRGIVSENGIGDYAASLLAALATLRKEGDTVSYSEFTVLGSFMLNKSRITARSYLSAIA